MSLVVCVFNVFNMLVDFFLSFIGLCLLFVGSLLCIAFKVWVEFLVCVKCLISCVFIV